MMDYKDDANWMTIRERFEIRPLESFHSAVAEHEAKFNERPAAVIFNCVVRHLLTEEIRQHLGIKPMQTHIFAHMIDRIPVGFFEPLTFQAKAISIDELILYTVRNIPSRKIGVTR